MNIERENIDWRGFPLTKQFVEKHLIKAQEMNWIEQRIEERRRAIRRQHIIECVFYVICCLSILALAILAGIDNYLSMTR